jgi:hypothetical protein
MMKSRLLPIFASAGLALALVAGARAEQTTHTLSFSDPSKPGTVKISLGRGELHVQGADTADVSVKSDFDGASKPRKDGMRVLSAASSFAFHERDNVITLDAASEWGGRANADFHLTVPRRTTLIVQNAWGGDITCGGIDGDIEINSMHGGIRLDDIAGGVVVGTMNGEIRASIRELNAGKPLSFTSMNGEVIVRVPESAKASVRLRTQNGAVLTDFEESALVTRTEATAGTARRSSFMKSGQVLTTEIQEAIREATQLSATAIKEALEAVKEGLEAARLNSDDARLRMEEAKRQMERARLDLERERQDAESRIAMSQPGRLPDAATPDAPKPPRAPRRTSLPPPTPATPTITGGKLVTGTLNGGGPEISVSTMNGDVILRKTGAK